VKLDLTNEAHKKALGETITLLADPLHAQCVKLLASAHGTALVVSKLMERGGVTTNCKEHSVVGRDMSKPKPRAVVAWLAASDKGGDSIMIHMDDEHWGYHPSAKTKMIRSDGDTIHALMERLLNLQFYAGPELVLAALKGPA